MQIETYQKRVVEIFKSIEQWVADAIKLEKKNITVIRIKVRVLIPKSDFRYTKKGRFKLSKRADGRRFLKATQKIYPIRLLLSTNPLPADLRVL